MEWAYLDLKRIYWNCKSIQAYELIKMPAAGDFFLKNMVLFGHFFYNLRRLCWFYDDHLQNFLALAQKTGGGTGGDHHPPSGSTTEIIIRKLEQLKSVHKLLDFGSQFLTSFLLLDETCG